MVPLGPASDRRSLIWEVALLAALATLARLIQLDHTPFIDEMNHVLAARSLLEEGDLTILDGDPYTRTRLFTYLVAGFFELFGLSLVVGRLPALLAGVALVCTLFLWVRRVGGRVAAWTAGLLLAFAPISIYLSQWVRFYTLHALLFWLAAIGVHQLVTTLLDRPERRRSRGPPLAAAVVLVLLLAYHLQVTTLVGVAGLGLWAVLVGTPAAIRGWHASQRKGWIVAGVVAGMALLIAGAFAAGIPEMVLRRITGVDTWAAGRAENPRFYHWILENQYGFLWALFPVALVLALARSFRTASLFATVFGVAFVVHSVAAWKSERYLFYAMPAFFGIWGLAIGEAVPWIRNRLQALLDRGPLTIAPGLRRPLVAAILVGAALFAAGGVQAFRISREILTQSDAAWQPPENHFGELYRGHADWAAASPELHPLVDSVAAVVSSSDLMAPYYLGRLDYVLYAGRIGTYGSSDTEFARWYKVGRPLISSASSIDLLMDCLPSGLVIAERHVWGWSGAVPDTTAAFIERQARQVPLPDSTRLLAYRWTTPTPERGDPACERIPPPGGAGVAAP